MKRAFLQMSHHSFNEPFRLPASSPLFPFLKSVTNSFSTARWILQLTLTKHVYSVTNVHFRYAKGVVLWKLNLEPKLILTWFAYRSYNPIFLFHLLGKNTQRLSCSLQEIPVENLRFLIWKIEKVCLVYTRGHIMSGYLGKKWHQYGNN